MSVKKNTCILFGGLVMDYYYSIDAWPVHSQDGLITGEESMVGGCAVNMAVTVMNLGGLAYVVSGVGEDETSHALEAYMKLNGLPLDMVKHVGGTSGKCLVFLEPDGERTFLTSKGAEGIFSDEMDEAARTFVPAAVGVTGYYLINKDAGRIMDCIEYLHDKGAKVLFDPSPLVSSIDDELLKRIISVSSVMTPNTAELEVIGRFTDIASYCADGKTLIVKSGGSGGTVYTGESRTFEYKAEKCDVIDTTGAGDSFAGAVIYAMMNDIDIEEAVKLAAKCAAVTVQTEGPHGFWKPEDLE
jgi:sugar/nucleoside kinase (ribokinase family)